MTGAQRTPEFAIDRLFHDRWSPRAFDTAVLDDDTLYSLFEAARWAPSANNSQPWRFIYARNGGPGWDELVSLLNENNRRWATRASALVLILSKKTHPRDGGEPQPLRNHSFDTGAAWASLAFQAHFHGWHTHAIGGYDREKARALLAVPEAYNLEIMVAIGRKAGLDQLHPDFHARETPNGCKPVRALVAEGAFTFTD